MSEQPVQVSPSPVISDTSTSTPISSQNTPDTQPTNRVKTDSLERRLGFIREYLAQGGSQRAFCIAKGLNGSTFNQWVNEYKRNGETRMRARHERGLAAGRHDGPYTPEERRQAVETYLKSGQKLEDFARVWGLGESTLRHWVERYQEGGPRGLESRVKPKGRPRRKGVMELIERVKRENPTFGFRKVGNFLGRIVGVKVSTGTVRNALKGKGYPNGGTKRKRQKPALPRRFERSVAGELWQSDITSFVLPRHGQRVYLTVFLDDFSRYIVSWGLALQQKQDLVVEALLSGIERFGKPKEVLTDQGRQYFAWRGKGDFQKLLRKEGIQHVVARTHHPQTVGKTERFWATVMEEFWGRVQPQELAEARERLGHFINHYNHFRPHQGIDGMVPADRFFGAETQVRKALEGQMARNELLMALGEAPRKPMYLVGQIGDQQLSIHGEKGRVVIQTPDGRIRDMGLDELGAGFREGGHGREREAGSEEIGKRAGEAEVQDAEQTRHGGEGAVGIGEPGGPGEGASDRGNGVGILDGPSGQGGCGPEAGGASAEGVAVVPAGLVGDGGGAGETAEIRQEETPGDVAARGEPEGSDQTDPEPGAGSSADPGTGEAPAGAPGQSGGTEKV